MISGLRGMPGWSLGNIVIGIALGLTFKTTRSMKNAGLRTAVECVVIVAATAAGILVVKSETESLLYAQPFLVRAAKNMSAFIADSMTLIISLPVCRLLDRYARKIMPELHV